MKPAAPMGCTGRNRSEKHAMNKTCPAGCGPFSRRESDPASLARYRLKPKPYLRHLHAHLQQSGYPAGGCQIALQTPLLGRFSAKNPPCKPAFAARSGRPHRRANRLFQTARKTEFLPRNRCFALRPLFLKINPKNQSAEADSPHSRTGIPRPVR